MQFRLSAVCLLLLWSLSTPGTALGQSRGDKPRFIIVSGSGEVTVRPDKALLVLGAEAQAPIAEEAQNRVNETMTRVIERLQRLKIPENAIQTTALRLSPVYAMTPPGSESEQPRVTGYRAENIVQVEITDLSLLVKATDAGIKAGANRLQDISFALENELPHRAEALKLAARNARAKAEALAQALKVRLGPIHKVKEGTSDDVHPPLPMMSMERAGVGTPVQLGQIRLQATVLIHYQISERGIIGD